MPVSISTQQTVIRTERGLSVHGTRITLYQIMDYMNAGWPQNLIRDRLNLSEEQIADIWAYMETHRPEVEAEYEEVLRQSDANRQYWEQQQAERTTASTTAPTNAREEALRDRLTAWKTRRGLTG